MTSLKLLLRTACRLQQVWQATSAQTFQNGQAALERLAARQRTLWHAQQLRDKACVNGWSLAAHQLQANVLRLVKAVHEAALDASASLEQDGPLVPSLAFLVAELRQVESEFDALQINGQDGFVSATTEAITLEHVNLGPFAIHFFWERLHDHASAACFDIVALAPNPAAADDRVTHPHVKSKKLCPGKSAAAIGKALVDGRLADAFCLIRSVLRQYNPNSPHIRLVEWTGRQCHDCDCSVDADDCTYCEGCDHDFCPDCSSSCAVCGNTRCDGCLARCAVCNEKCCSGCLKLSVPLRRNCCRACLRTCATCGAQFGKDDLVSGSDRCVSCAAPTSTPIPDSLSLENDHATILEHNPSAAA